MYINYMEKSHQLNYIYVQHCTIKLVTFPLNKSGPDVMDPSAEFPWVGLRERLTAGKKKKPLVIEQNPRKF